jgi:putative cardiolipin synthase
MGLAFALALALAGCATSLPTEKPPPGYAAAPREDGRLAALERQLTALHGADASGFQLLERNADGLKWRLVLIDNASHSIDLQY